MENIKHIKILNQILIFVGFSLTFIIAVLCIVDSGAEDIVSAIPPAIFTASLFLAGYIGNTIIIVSEKKDFI